MGYTMWLLSSWVWQVVSQSSKSPWNENGDDRY